jgi:hypothetical protein
MPPAHAQNSGYGQVFRRLYERRATDTCVGQVDSDIYPVENWSQGGVLLGGDNRYFAVHEQYDVTLKFRLHDRILDIKHPARVVRKVGEKTAFQFLPLTPEIRKSFSQVIDDLVASGFANSQG